MCERSAVEEEALNLGKSGDEEFLIIGARKLNLDAGDHLDGGEFGGFHVRL